MKTLNLNLLLSLLLLLTNCNDAKNDKASINNDEMKVFVSPLGTKLSYPTPSAQLLQKYQEAKKTYEATPTADNLIWYGRRAAYLANYEEAIRIYTEGTKSYPKDARIYRHRGHRYISIRKFDEAIADLSKAAELIAGTPNEIEPDGMPNAKNIPVSTLHGNIYYHLGLAHYLKGAFENALEAYQKCRDSGSNADNIVSSTHWLYMIQRRMGNDDLANEMLLPISNDLEIIENHDYYTLCKFYKGLIPIDSIQFSGDSPASDAIKYGLANWHLYNGDKKKAQAEFEEILKGKSWTSFGYIAAETEILNSSAE
jgi:tetratricopeptide (TPR) repeat protein